MSRTILLLTLFTNYLFGKNILFLGDSLTEGYGVSQESTYTYLLQEKLKKNSINWIVINSGISGSTSASGPGRAKWILKSKEKPNIVVIVLGANDGLRGLPIAAMKKNLLETIKILSEGGVRPILGALMVPPNYGQNYSDEFKKVFVDISKKENVLLMPFILKNVAGKANLNLADGIHPNEKGHQLIAQDIFDFLKPILKSN